MEHPEPQQPVEPAPTTAFAGNDRVRRHTDPFVMARLDERTTQRLLTLSRDPQALNDRLGDLDREWDIERALEANAATLMLGGVVTSLVSGRRVPLVLPAAVAWFLLQHAVQGWCPPLALLRRLGLRTRQEIDAERAALLSMLADVHDDALARARLRSGLPASGDEPGAHG